MRFVGVDLAWGSNQPTGVCAIGKDVESGMLRTDAEILEWLEPRVAAPCLVAFDAPLVLRNPAGRRPCESALQRCFGRYAAGPHSSNTARLEPRAERLAQALDLDVDPWFAPRADVRRAIEVYPHPATVALFGLERSLPYKARGRRGGRVARTIEERHATERPVRASWEISPRVTS